MYNTFSGNKTLDQRLSASPKTIFLPYIAHFSWFFLFFAFSYEKQEKSIFWPVLGMHSTQMLVKIFNTSCPSFKKITSLKARHKIKEQISKIIRGPFQKHFCLIISLKCHFIAKAFVYKIALFRRICFRNLMMGWRSFLSQALSLFLSFFFLSFRPTISLTATSLYLH